MRKEKKLVERRYIWRMIVEYREALKTMQKKHVYVHIIIMISSMLISFICLQYIMINRSRRVVHIFYRYCTVMCIFSFCRMWLLTDTRYQTVRSINVLCRSTKSDNNDLWMFFVALSIFILPKSIKSDSHEKIVRDNIAHERAKNNHMICIYK